MSATIQLFLALGLGPVALVADLLLTLAVLAVGTLVTARAGRLPRPITAEADTDVVAEAESVVAGAAHHQTV